MSGISFSGIGSGVDTKRIVDALVNAEIAPLKAMAEGRKSNLDAQLSGIGRLKSALNDFKTVADDLKTADKFQVRSATVSNEDLLSVTADSKAQPGSYEVTVENLAKSQRLISAAGQFENAQSTVGTGTLSFGTSGAYDPAQNNGFSIEITAENSSLEDIRDAVNNAADNDVVSASIVNVDDGAGGTEARLVFTAKETGVANQVTISASETGDPGLSRLASANMDLSRAAVDAKITVNGLDAYSSTNQFSEVISGVTLDVKEQEPGTAVEVTIGTDNAAIEKNVQGFVDAYNKLQGVIKSMGDSETSGLKGDSTLRTLRSEIRSLAASEVDSSSNLSILAEVGVSIDKDGRMSLDKSELGDMLAKDFSSVSNLFSSDNGVAKRMTNYIDAFTQAGGLLDNRTQSVNNQIRSAENQIERVELREENLFNRLSKQFNAMDRLVSQINSSASMLIASLNGMNRS